MTKPDKLHQLLLASTSRSVRFRDFERLIIAFGFRLERVKGSHRHYIHANVPTVLTINPSKGDAHRYQMRLLLELVEEYALSIEA